MTSLSSHSSDYSDNTNKSVSLGCLLTTTTTIYQYYLVGKKEDLNKVNPVTVSISEQLHKPVKRSALYLKYQLLLYIYNIIVLEPFSPKIIFVSDYLKRNDTKYYEPKLCMIRLSKQI